MSQQDFQGRVVVITGAGSGIGRALAQQFAAAGARLALSDINQAGLDETPSRIPALKSSSGNWVSICGV